MDAVTMHPWLADLHATLDHSLQSPNAWMDLAGQALADSEVADQHEGRFLVELLQNVRDAWCMHPGEGQAGSALADRPARAALVVTDQGLLVADQGAGFDLDDPEVLEAVKRLRRSSKPGAAGEAVGLAGHKGIGLKAILRRCQAFQVWSHVGDRQVAADFRRSRTLEILREKAAHVDPGLRQLVESEIAFVPLFRFPHPMGNGERTEDLALVEGLLNGTAGLEPVEDGFNTVVRLDFSDEEWEAELDHLDRRHATIPVPKLDAEAVWRQVSEVDPRTVLLLGTLGRVDLLRVSGERVVEHARIEIEPEGPTRQIGDSVRHRRFHVRCSGDVPLESTSQQGPWDIFAGSAELLLDDYDEANEGFAEVCVALPRLALDKLHGDLPLAMYYPIQSPGSERGDGLPFVLHGPFLVKPDRTGLDHGDVATARNQSVLDAARRIAVKAGEWLAIGGRDGEADPDVPWCLCPSSPAGEQKGIVGRFRQQLLADLAAAKVLTSAAGETCAPGDGALLSSAQDLVALNRSLHLAHLFRECAGDVVPDPVLLARAVEWAERCWDGRTERLVGLLGGTIDPVRLADALDRWSRDLDEQALATSGERAGAVGGEVLAILRRGGDDAAAFLRRVSDGSLPVIPCIGADGSLDGQDTVRLVRAAALRRESGRAIKKARVVLYRRSRGDDDEASDPVEAVKPPPEVPIYLLLEPEWSAFRDHGRDLGLREEGGDPALVDEVLERALPASLPSDAGEADEQARVGSYLAALLDRIAGRRDRAGQEWLDARPAGWIPKLGLWRETNSKHERDRRRAEREAMRWRNRQRARRVGLPVEGGGWAPAHTTFLTAAWRDAAVVALTDEDDGRERVRGALAAAEDHLGAIDALRPLARPDDARWRVWAERASGEGDVALARLVLFLGTWATPRIHLGWLWPLALRRAHDEPDTSVIGDQTGWDWLARSAPELAREADQLLALLQEPELAAPGDGIHYSQCFRGNARHRGDGYGSRTVRQAWFIDSQAPGFDEAAAACLAAGWLDEALSSRWTCRCYGRGRGPSIFLGKRVLPTLASRQLTGRLVVATTRRSEMEEAPLAVALAPSAAESGEEREQGLRHYMPVWDGRLGGQDGIGGLSEALRLPIRPEHADGQRAASTLAWLRDALVGRQPNHIERGLLAHLLRRVLEPAAVLLKTEDEEWPSEARAVLRASLSIAGSLPCVLRDTLVWVPLVSTPDSPAGRQLDEIEGRRVAVLGSSRKVTRVDRERVRGRCVLLSPEVGRLGPLAQMRRLVEALGAEFVEGTQEPPLRFQEAPDVDPEPYRRHLVARRGVVVAFCQKDRSVEGVDERFDRGLTDLRCVRDLKEDFEGAPRPIPSAWMEEGDVGALLIDVDQIRVSSGLGDLAWGVAGLLGSFDRLAGYMALLGARTPAAIDSVARALGVATDQGAPPLPRRARVRLAWLSALLAGQGIAARAEALLRDESWPEDAAQVAAALPDPLGRSGQLYRGWLDLASLTRLASLLEGSDWTAGRAAFLSHADLEFRPNAADRAGAIPRALRQLALVLAWRAEPDVDGLVDALSRVDDRLDDLDLTVGRALGESDLVPPDVAAIDVWGADAALAVELTELAQTLGGLPEVAAQLLDAGNLDERRACLAEHRDRERSRREQARPRCWERIPQGWSAAAPMGSTALLTSRRGEASSGFGGGAPSIEATERGAVGELVALSDVLARLLDLWRRDTEAAARALSTGIRFADTLRPAKTRSTALDVDELRRLLTLASEGDRDTIENLAQRLDLSAVRGPGFDIVDPLPPLMRPDISGPTRVEVKTTNQPMAPGGSVVFRLTVNELYRAQSREEPYVIRIYHDPGGSGLPELQAEVVDPASLVAALADPGGRALLEAVRGGGHVFLTARLG